MSDYQSAMDELEYRQAVQRAEMIAAAISGTDWWDVVVIATAKHDTDAMAVTVPLIEAARRLRAEREALPAASGHGLRLWTCPLCARSTASADAPDGWMILSPFDRVASCADCRPAMVGVHQ